MISDIKRVLISCYFRVNTPHNLLADLMIHSLTVESKEVGNENDEREERFLGGVCVELLRCHQLFLLVQ